MKTIDLTKKETKESGIRIIYNSNDSINASVNYFYGLDVFNIVEDEEGDELITVRTKDIDKIIEALNILKEEIKKQGEQK